MTSCPASLYSSMVMSFRKSASDTSLPRPLPSVQTRLAQALNSGSWVRPRSRVMASYFVRPGDLRLVVRLEDDPLQTALQARLDEERGSADRQVLPLAGQFVRPLPRPRAPDDGADDREGAETIHADLVQIAILVVGQRNRQPLHADDRRLRAGRRLPHAALRVGARADAGHRAAGNEVVEQVVAEGIGNAQPRIEH